MTDTKDLLSEEAGKSMAELAKLLQRAADQANEAATALIQSTWPEASN